VVSRQRVLVAVVAVVVLLGGCAFYRADECRDARERERVLVVYSQRTTTGTRVATVAEGYAAAAIAWAEASGDVARWRWPVG
jgi:hypothetical protein